MGHPVLDRQSLVMECRAKGEVCQGCGGSEGCARSGPRHFVFCQACTSSRPYCAACQAPVGPTARCGKQILCCRCFECVSDGANGEPGVVSERKAQELAEDVLLFLSEALGMECEAGFSLTLLDKIEASASGANDHSDTLDTRGRFELAEAGPAITVKKGLSETMFMAVFAHEFTHAWQSENCPRQSLELMEGLARWVQRKILYELYDDNAATELDQCPLAGYGPGLRACLDWEQALGEHDLLSAVREWEDFPS